MNELFLGSNRPTTVVDDAVHIIVHGELAGEQALADALAVGYAMLRNNSRREWVVRYTTGPGHAVALAREAALERAGRIIAVGGDATLNEVVRGLMSVAAERRPALGVVPRGTVNDFAAGAGLSPDPERAMRDALTGEPRWADVGCSNVRGTGHWFLNLATGGVLNDGAPRLDPGEEPVGGLAYAVAGVLGLPAMQAVELELRGESFAWSGSVYALAVGNGRTAGGGFSLCPDASIVDGELDVTVIPATLGFADVLELIDERGVAGVDAIPRFRSPWVEFDFFGHGHGHEHARGNTRVHLNIDGGPRSVSRGRFEVVARGLELVLPSDSPLLT